VSWQQRISWQENERTHEALCKSSSDYIANSCTNIAQVKDGTWGILSAYENAPWSIKGHTATAHKLARLVYFILKHGWGYVDPGQDWYDKQYQEPHYEVFTEACKRSWISACSTYSGYLSY